MKIPKSDLRIEFMRGQGKGGQHRNRRDSACRITHLPTGITAYADERSQHHSRKLAMKTLQQRLVDRKAEAEASQKKARRDHVIHNTATIRTYDFKSGVVVDYRSGKKATIKQVLGKGKLELLKCPR